MSSADDHTLHSVELVGLSYRTAPVEVLERLALAPEEQEAFYTRLRAAGVVRDAVVLSTCNRTEIYAAGQNSHAISDHVMDVLADVTGKERLPHSEHLYKAKGRDSVTHLLRVACGLDSMILGEAQILGQVKSAYERSCQQHPPSAEFDRLMQAAFKVARRSRAHTEIGRGAVSVASAAVHLTTRIYSDLSSRTVVVVGAGDTGRLVATHFAARGPKRIIVLNRTFERAEQVAQEVGGEARSLDELVGSLAEADVAACAIRTAEPLLTHELVARSMHERSGRSLALLDLGLPRNVAGEVNGLANVFVHDLESLKQVVDANLAKRRKEVPRVEELISREVDKLLSQQQMVPVGPLIGALRQSVERVRQAEVARAAKNLGPTEREAVDRATRAIVNKLLHGPTTAIKDMARQQEEGAERLQLIRGLFGNLQLGDESERDDD